LQAQLWETEKEIVELRRLEADQRKRYFKMFRDLASHCVDDQGRVQWDFLKQALFSEDGRITLFPRHADGT
jgi:hypothetical protein